MTEDRLWFVLTTEPQSEFRVQERTEHLGNEVYIPIARTFAPQRRVGRIAAPAPVAIPLFRGYAFVNLPTANPPFRDYVDSELINAPPQSVEFWEGGVLKKVEVRSGDDARIGGVGFISSNFRPAPLAPGIIEDLKAREAAGEFDETALTENERYVIPNWIRQGERFTVVRSGPFFAYGGSIIEAINSKIVACWIHMFGTTTRTTMAIADIRKFR